MSERKTNEARTGRLNVANLVTVVGVVALVGTEVIGVALAAGWAIAGLLDLGDAVSYGLMAAFAALGLYAMVLFVRRALKIEPIWG